MLLTTNRNAIRWLIISVSFIVISLILWNTYIFFQNFKAEERTKMDIWASAQAEFQKSLLEDNINPIISKVLISETYNPMLVVDQNNEINTLKKSTIKKLTIRSI